MAAKVYAVRKGKKPGIYHSWNECKVMVDGYPGAIYKSFKTFEEAKAFLGDAGAAEKEADKAVHEETSQNGQEVLPAVYAFVDGSFNSAMKRYGYGGFLVHDGEREILQGCGEDAEMHPCGMWRERYSEAWLQSGAP